MAPVRTDECRLCGGEVTRKKSVKDLAHDILLSSLHEVDVSNDDPAIHPPYVCLCCQNKLKRWRVKKNKSKAKEKINIMFVNWNSTPEPVVTPAEAAKITSDQLGIVSWIESGYHVFVKNARGGIGVERNLVIKTDNSWEASIYGQKLKCDIFETIPIILQSAADGSRLIAEVFGRTICVGNLGFDDIVGAKSVLKDPRNDVVAYVTVVPDNTNNPTTVCKTVRHIKCKILTESGVCDVCRIYRSNLSALRNRQRNQMKTPNTPASSSTRNDFLKPAQLKDKLDDMKRQNRNLRYQNETLQAQIKAMHEKEAIEVSDEAQETLLQKAFVEVEDDIKEINNDAFHLLYEEQKKALKVKDGRQIRWHPAIIRFCIALYNKSKSAYNLIRDSPFLALPHQSTLKKYMKFTTPQNGINADVLNYMATDWKIETLPEYQRNVTLVFDEIKIKAGLVYAKTTGQVIGYTDLGPITNELEQFNKNLEKHSNQEEGPNQPPPAEPNIATQMLVLMARGIFSSMRIPVAYYPTKNANSSELYHCIWPTVKALTLVGLTVRAFVADGASWNRKFFLGHEMLRQPGRVVYYTKHRYCKGNRLYFICDVPHLVKTTRNNFENSGWNLKSRNLWVR